MSILWQGVAFMARKENQRIALTRRLLQEGLLRLLRVEKLENISVTALCKEAGINRATFYNHYTSPTALLSEMEQQFVSELETLAKAPSSIDEIADILEQQCIKLKEHADLVSILVHYQADRDIEKIFTNMASYYGKNRLDVNKTHMDADTTHLVSTFLYSGCYILVREWLIRDIRKTPREIAELILSMISKDYL